MAQTRAGRWLAGLCAGLLFAGCAYVPPGMMAQEAAPAASGPPSPFARDRIVVLPVTGVHPGFWQLSTGEPMVQPTTLQAAIVRSLVQSGLFASVSDGGSARFELRTEILRQDKFPDGVSVVIRYLLRDTSTDRAVLAQEIESGSRLSEDAAPGVTGISPGAAFSRAAFRATGRNLGLLIERLRTLQAP